MHRWVDGGIEEWMFFSFSLKSCAITQFKVEVIASRLEAIASKLEVGGHR